MCAAARSNELYRTNMGTAIKIRPEPGPRPRLRGQEFVRVLADEKRQFPRLPLKLALTLKRVDGRPEPKPAELQTVDISCSGIRFLSGRALEPGTPVDLEVTIAENPLGGPSMRMFTSAHIVRHSADERGLHYMAAEFDHIDFDRDPAPEAGGNAEAKQ